MSLENVLTWDQPFGPNATEKIAQDLFEEILDDTNSAYIALKTRPFLIVGRRGAGKTSMLSAIKLSGKFDTVVDVPPSQAFQKLVKIIDESKSETIIEETVAEAWEKIIWNFVFLRIYADFKSKRPKDTAIIGNYLTKVGLKPNSLPGQLMSFLLKLVKKDSEAASDAVALLNEILDANSEYDQVLELVKGILKESRTRCVVLIDNIEKIDLSKISMRLSVAGLLMAVDTFKNASIPIDVRCSIPAEIFPRLADLAANSDKSLDSKLVLHWSSNELLHMAAIRYREFLRNYGTPDVQKRIKDAKLDEPEGLDAFMHQFFPRRLKNGRDYEEFTLRYIIRHTQLLPRQFITYLNEIARKSFEARRGDSFEFSEQSVIRGVRAQEGLVCQGIFSGYRTVFPYAKRVCQILLPQLSLTFSFGELEVQFRQQRGKLVDDENNPLFPSVNACLEMLTEIGAVGVKVDEDDEYIHAEFSYNLPLNLAYRIDDTFCLHPAFSGTYRSDINSSKYKPIFPQLGSD
ncbi:MAG: ATP-binding protein [Rhodobacteraceae bacterium]|nr:ATP-binding protein [Paracoccaceae bacterium]